MFTCNVSVILFIHCCSIASYVNEFYMGVLIPYMNHFVDTVVQLCISLSVKLMPQIQGGTCFLRQAIIITFKVSVYSLLMNNS